MHYPTIFSQVNNDRPKMTACMRLMTLCGVFGATALLSACGGSNNIAATQATNADVLRFDPNSGGTPGTVNVYGQEIKYTAYTVTYVAHPSDPEKQVMTIYIPSTATQTSPIFMPFKTGAYLQSYVITPSDVTTDNINTPSTGTNGTGATHAAALALSKGIVVASPAARGRDSTLTINGVVNEVGNGPASIVDLKAAIRYLKHNDAVMLGDANKIVVSGTSGGGAFSSILGASGDSPAYKPYLDALGAADASDSIFGASPFCPITDLDNADAAYEYYFYGSGITTVNLSGPPGTTMAPITLTANDQKLSTEMAKLYPEYINGLALKNPSTGAVMRLNTFSADSTMGGTYKDYALSVLGTAATTFIINSGYVNTDGTLNAAGQTYLTTPATINSVLSGVAPGDFLTWDSSTRTASITNWAKYMTFMNRLKPVGAFDNGFYTVTGEMDLFSTDPAATANDITVAAGWNHMDYNLGLAISNAGLRGTSGYTSVNNFIVPDTVAQWAAMMNPMYYIAKYNGLALNVNPYANSAYGSSTVAKNWRIRVGSYDRDGTPFFSLNLATALQNSGKNVDYKIFWNQPHTGSYDNTDLIAWILSISQ